MTRATFDYSSLPFSDIAARYRKGVSWRALAAEYGAPDHKTFAKWVTDRVPDLEVRDHAEAQRARRDREGTSRRRVTSGVKQPKWWKP